MLHRYPPATVYTMPSAPKAAEDATGPSTSAVHSGYTLGPAGPASGEPPVSWASCRHWDQGAAKTHPRNQSHGVGLEGGGRRARGAYGAALFFSNCSHPRTNELGML
jgi:hypothetical protein